ncbi:MAG: undecaprenyl-diphosphate phosphatase [Rhodothermales bacterium]|nr:undecaprenyl-diphosphate phosphatase [Rhodothermales bacterium]MBO6778385.1 undecaprenyl-diphosphate phosphatase [Rhodothermales bacterium]
MTWWEALILGLVQGLTEFLPVSSSGHLVLGAHVLGLEAEGDVVFEVFVHFGTALSIIWVYRERIVGLIMETLRSLAAPGRLVESYREREDFRLAMLILLTLIPTGLAYVLFKDPIEAAFSSPRFAAGMLLVTGTLLLLTVWRSGGEKPVGPLKALVIGAAQAMAMFPGISRSGSTICTALYMDVEPEKAANFSFLMLLPVVIGATVLKTGELMQASSVDWVPIVTGTAIAFVSGIAAIHLVLDFVRRGKLQYFAVYCYIVGVLGLVLIPG